MPGTDDSWDEQPIDEGPGEHDTHLMADDPSDTTPCARCGEEIWAYSQRCHHCGLHFSGEAWQFTPAGEAQAPVRQWWRWVAALVVVAMLWWLLSYFVS